MLGGMNTDHIDRTSHKKVKNSGSVVERLSIVIDTTRIASNRTAINR